MADEAPIGIAIGDRSQGYEVTGPGQIAGMDTAFAGKDTRDRDAAVTLIWLAKEQDQSALFDSSSSYERLGAPAMVGLRTIVRFGGGSAAVIGKEQGAPLDGETLGLWLKRRAPLTLASAATLLIPALKALSALHAKGLAHGHICAAQGLIGRDGGLKVLGPWLAEGGEAREQFILAQAPELVSGDAPRPVSDVYSVLTLLYWALTGNPAPSAEARLASKAQRDEDPLLPVSNLVPGLPEDVVRMLETGLRLHPATRPQSIASVIDVLEPHAGAIGVAIPDGISVPPPPLPSSTRQTPWGPKKSNPSEAAPKTRGVPPISRRPTSSIGQAPRSTPPPLPQRAPQGGGTPDNPKRKLGIGTIISFIIALAVAWIVASEGMFGDEDRSVETPAQREIDSERDSAQPETIEIDNQPRKGPASNEADEDAAENDDGLEDASNRTPDGVTQQFCTSRFTFETARNAGTNALRAYLRRCNGVESEFVDAARDALDG